MGNPAGLGILAAIAIIGAAITGQKTIPGITRNGNGGNGLARMGLSRPPLYPGASTVTAPLTGGRTTVSPTAYSTPVTRPLPGMGATVYGQQSPLGITSEELQQGLEDSGYSQEQAEQAAQAYALYTGV
jgi:hypothetical protein